MTDKPEPAKEKPGAKSLGKYSLTRELGRGGMGVVYEALDTDLKRKVALKVLIKAPLANAQAAALEEERFVREAQLSAKLKHPNIVTVFEAGVLEGTRFFAMQLIEGVPLSAWLRKDSGIGLRQKIAVLRDVALAVAHAHEEGVLHRDLKPQNVLLDSAGRPYVTDFGLAKETGHDATVSLTLSGSVVGTPSYMSPEQARGLKSVDARSDVYSLGVILYEMLSGRTPFQGDTPLDIMMKVVKNPVPPPSTVTKNWQESMAGDAVENICLRAMAKNPRERFPSARALAEDLSRWLKGERPRASAPSARSPMKWVWISVGAAAAVGLGIFALLPPQKTSEEPTRTAARGAVERSAADPERERLAKERSAAAAEAERLRREVSKEREEGLLREAERQKQEEAGRKVALLEKEALSEKLREAEERARTAEVEARKAKENSAPTPAEPRATPSPSRGADAPPRVPEPAPGAAPSAKPDPPKAPAPPAPPGKPTEPAPAELKAAVKAVQARYKDDYAKKIPSEKRALAARLLESGLKEGEDPTKRYAYLQESREIAAQNADAETTVAAIEALVRIFALDPKPLRSQTLITLARNAAVPASMKEAAAAGIRLSTSAVSENDFDAALQLLGQCDLLAKKAKDAAILASVQERVRDVTEMRKEWSHVRAAFKTLQEKPDDPASCSAAGKFLSFVKQDWEHGIPYLARGSDEVLKSAALREAGASSPSLLSESGDAWTALTEKQTGAKLRVFEHGMSLYKRAWPDAEGPVKDALRAKFRSLFVHAGRVTPALPALWGLGEDSVKDPFSLDEGCLHGGRASLRVAASPKPGSILIMMKKLFPGRTCTLSAWILTDGTEAFPDLVVAGTSDGKNDASAMAFPIAAPADQPWWTLVQTTFTIPPDTGAMSVTVQYGWNAGTIWVDDVSCRLDDGTELVENGGFDR